METVVESVAATKPVTYGADLGAPPKALDVDPANVSLNASGHVFQNWFVRLPAGIVADDLKRPEIWKKVQLSRSKAFKKFDTVMAVAFDESWIAEAVVADAGADKVVLGRPRVTTLPERYQALFQDDRYRVKWFGSGYAVERKADGHRVTEIVATAQMAERDLVNLDPRQA